MNNSRTVLNREDILKEMRELTERSHYGRSEEARFQALSHLAKIQDAGDGRERPQYGSWTIPSLGDLHQEILSAKRMARMDPMTLRFFGGSLGAEFREQRELSVAGGTIQKIQNAQFNGKSYGSVTELRDFSVLLPEARTYTAMNEGTGSQGGFVVPIGYIPTLFMAAKQIDQILEAADWSTAATATGNPVNMPTLSDVAVSAVKVSESGPFQFQNPTAFSQVQWPTATTWTSRTILASRQLEGDAVPALASTLARAFALRIARGFGADCVSTVLADSNLASATTAGATAITNTDLLELVKAVDPVYANAPTAGWCMNWNTLIYIFEHVVTSTTSGDWLLRAQRDAAGHYLLLGKPVFVSPSMADIGAGAQTVLFGDLARIQIRNVPTMARLLRFDELYLATHQVGFELLWRGDSQVIHAGNGSGDKPLAVLVQHS